MESIAPAGNQGKKVELEWTPTNCSESSNAIHRDKNIDKEIVFLGIEAALVSAAKKHYGEESNVVVEIDRTSGTITGMRDGVAMATTEIAERMATKPPSRS